MGLMSLILIALCVHCGSDVMCFVNVILSDAVRYYIDHWRVLEQHALYFVLIDIITILNC